ncbi:alpha/beta fold hydrolase [Oryzibacter oryziterrae]|uniref:alpha/beta fold hydrolase n=1 Tax=Oryzibacter oryziterrae TaxID=2766474 RepID=UPI001F2EE360|nr:alpha/beta fold hydrolase [Oryzibacter oryziterrae]
MKLSKINAVELAWDSFGREEDPAILLIAGLGTQMIRWAEPFCGYLAGLGYRVIRFDNRDAGASTHFGAAPPLDLGQLVSDLSAGRRPQLPYSLADMADDAIGLLDALDIRQAHVVGRSMGGMIAQILASEHAERVLSLTSIMSSTGNPDLPQATPEVMAMMMRPAPDPATDPDGFLAVRLAFARCIAGSGFPFDVALHRDLLLEEARRGHDPSGVVRQIGAMVTAGDRRNRLAAILAPTLVIHGTDDPLIPPACGEDTARSIPGSTYLPIEGMGHDIPEGAYRTVADGIDANARRAAINVA